MSQGWNTLCLVLALTIRRMPPIPRLRAAPFPPFPFLLTQQYMSNHNHNGAPLLCAT